MADTAAGWIEEMYALVAAGETDDAIDVLFDAVDDACLEGRFDDVDVWCESIDVTKLGPDLLVAVLCITHAPKPYLSKRAALFARIHDRLYELVPDEAAELLRERD